MNCDIIPAFASLSFIASIMAFMLFLILPNSSSVETLSFLSLPSDILFTSLSTLLRGSRYIFLTERSMRSIKRDVMRNSTKESSFAREAAFSFIIRLSTVKVRLTIPSGYINSFLNPFPPFRLTSFT